MDREGIKVSHEHHREFLLSGCSRQASDSLIDGDQSACTLWWRNVVDPKQWDRWQ